jgi:hypothetical protein
MKQMPLWRAVPADFSGTTTYYYNPPARKAQYISQLFDTNNFFILPVRVRLRHKLRNVILTAIGRSLLSLDRMHFVVHCNKVSFYSV